jgi:hypothetical protein
MPRMNVLRAGILGLLIVGLAVGALAVPSAAQESSPSPTPQPDQEQVRVVGLPFAATFDTPAGWNVSGAWRFDTRTAYDGGGWLLDGAARNTISILEYGYTIDLSGTLSAQLMMRQRGTLPISDFVAVDLSLDGGTSWIMVDQQIGLDTDWETHIVDLTYYRGQVIRLRFRVCTGAPLDPADPREGSYRLDNVTVQYVFVPQVVFAPADLAPHTLMGLHLVMGAESTAVIDLARRLKEIGWPLGTLKGTTGTEGILNQVETISPETVTVYRALATTDGMRDCPNTHSDPVAEAWRWLDSLAPAWRGVRADYFEIMNECLPPPEWLVPFSIEAMRIANQRGQCLLLFSFSAGQPTPEVFAQLLPVLDYALKNPCASGRLHGIALHAYGINPTTLVSESGINLGFRHRLLFGSVLQQLPEALLVPVYLTEAGPGDGRAPFSCADIVRDVLQYTRQLEYDPYVRGFHLWNVGPTGGWLDATPCLPAIADALVSYYGSR